MRLRRQPAPAPARNPSTITVPDLPERANWIEGSNLPERKSTVEQRQHRTTVEDEGEEDPPIGQASYPHERRRDSGHANAGPMPTRSPPMNHEETVGVEELPATGHDEVVNFRNRASNALQIQQSASEVVQRIKQSTMLGNPQWTVALRAAPDALKAMAVCFKVASDKSLGTIKIDPKITNVDGSEYCNLHYDDFNVCLQDCSDTGRAAFNTARAKMNSLQGLARYMISEEGSIAQIIELINDPTAAVDELQYVVEELKEDASKCKAEAEIIQSKFEHWQKVIEHLQKQAILQGKITSENQTETDGKQKKALGHLNSLRTKKKEALKTVKQARDAHALAAIEVANAMMDIQENLDERTDHTAPSSTLIEAAVPLADEPKQGFMKTGILTYVGRSLVGQSYASQKKEQSVREDHADRAAARRREFISEWEEMRARKQQADLARLQAAQERQGKASKNLDNAIAKYSETTEQVYQVSKEMSDVSADLNRLASRKCELTEIYSILKRSAEGLSNLKGPIEELNTLFQDIETIVSTTFKQNLRGFLAPIERGITRSSGITPDSNDPTTVEQLRIHRISKRHLLSNAYELQGRLSGIADVASTYVAVSQRYITPGINKMESLVLLSDGEYKVRLREFEMWAEDSIAEIEMATKKARRNMDVNMEKHVEFLQRKLLLPS